MPCNKYFILIWGKCEFSNYFIILFPSPNKNMPKFPMPNRGSCSFKTAKKTL